MAPRVLDSWEACVKTLRLIVLLVGMSAVLNACSVAQRVSVLSPPPESGTELAIRFVLNLPVVDLTIEDEPVSLIVDLGGYDTITLTQDAVDRVGGIRATWRWRFWARASGRLQLDREIVVPRLAIGSCVLENIRGHRIQLDVPAELKDQVDGYIGAGILTNFALLVDYPARLVIFSDASACEQDTSSWIHCPLSRARTSPGKLAATPVTVGWDTGASHNVIDPSAAAGIVSAGGINSSGTPFTTTVWIGNHAFRAVEMRQYNLRGAHVDVLLGHGFFVRHRVLFDFKNKCVLIEP